MTMYARGGSKRLVSLFKAKHRFNWMSVLSSSQQQETRDGLSNGKTGAMLAVGGLFLSYMSTTDYADCKKAAKPKELPDENHWTPSRVAKENFEDVVESHDIDKLPSYTSDEVAANNGEDGSPVWMSYGGVVYDVTDFIQNHPGGSHMIMQAAGSAIEPYWHIYRQHYASDLPTRLMEHMVIGTLDDKDQVMIDEQMTVLHETGDDPYALEPLRHKALKVHSDQPMNAECPGKSLNRADPSARATRIAVTCSFVQHFRLIRSTFSSCLDKQLLDT